MEEPDVKKILCCSSLVSDLLVAAALDDKPRQLKRILESPEAAEFVAAADALAAIMKD